MINFLRHYKYRLDLPINLFMDRLYSWIYLTNNPSWQLSFTRNASTRSKKKIEHATITDKVIINQVVQKLQLSNEDKTFLWILLKPCIEFVKCLSNEDLKTLIIFENDESKIKKLRDVEDNCQTSFVIDHSKRFTLTSEFPNLINDFDSKIDHISTENNLRILCLFPYWLHSVRFINIVLKHLINDTDNIFRRKDVEFIFLYSEKQFKLHTSSYPPSIIQTYSLFGASSHLFLDCSLIAKVPVHKIKPLPTFQKYKKEKRDEVWNNEHMHLVKVSIKEQFRYISDPEDLPVFLFFMQTMLVSKTSRLIPRLESLFPGCGISVLKLRYSMLHCVKDLSPDEFWKLFNIIKKWPEFHHSGFISAYRHTSGIEDNKI